MSPEGHTGEGGFTLVEVLVSLFIFAIISVGTLAALSSTLNAREASQTRISEIEQLAAARRLMADDFATMIIRRNRDGLGGFIDRSLETPRNDRFELTRRARPNPDGLFPRGDLLRVSWRVENGQLIRAFLPHENPAYVEPAIDRVVLEGVESLRVEQAGRANSINELLSSVQRSENVDIFLTGPAISILLTHDDGSTTQHIFELPDA